MDVWTSAYVCGLVFTLGVALLSWQRPRVLGALYMAVSWVAIFSITRAWGITPTLLFALVDAVTLTVFITLWVCYQRSWAMVVSALHVCMLLSHLAVEISFSGGAISGTPRFIYLSILYSLGYASMGAIILTPLTNGLRNIFNPGGRSEDFSYIRALPLRGWPFRVGPRETEGPEE